MTEEEELGIGCGGCSSCSCGSKVGSNVAIGSAFPWLAAKVSGQDVIGISLVDFARQQLAKAEQPGPANPLGLKVAEFQKRATAEKTKALTHPVKKVISEYAKRQPAAELAEQKRIAAATIPGVVARGMMISDSTGDYLLDANRYKKLTDHAIWFDGSRWLHRGIEIPADSILANYRLLLEGDAKYRREVEKRRNKPGFFKKITRAIKKVPVLGHAVKAADSVLKSTVVNVLQDVLNNPFISTAFGQIAIPANLLLGAAKNGPQGALDVAKRELNNPVRGVAVKAAALVFPPLAPAAAGLEAARRVVDALESKNPAEAIKAVAQVAATTALAQSGDLGAVKGLEFLNKAKAMSNLVPKNILTPVSNARVEVCGAKSEEARGLWLKTNIRRTGNHLIATVYSVSNGDAEVVNLKVDLVPIVRALSAAHKRLHGTEPVIGASTISSTALQLGRAKLVNAAFNTSKQLAGKAVCKLKTPTVPVSNAALAVFAAARKGVDAVDQAKKFDLAANTAANNVRQLAALKKRLAGLTPAQRSRELQNPTNRAILLKGLGSKQALARFVATGGTQKAKVIKAAAKSASNKFAAINANLNSPDPAKRNAAQHMAKAVTIAARARASTQNAVQNNKGGVPGIVIDSRGRIRKSGKRSFLRRTPKANERAQVLIPRKGPVQTGIFEIAGTRQSAAMKHRARLIGRLANIRGQAKQSLNKPINVLQSRLRHIRSLSVVSGACNIGVATEIPNELMEQAELEFDTVGAVKKKAAPKKPKSNVKRAVSKLPPKKRVAVVNSALKKMKASEKKALAAQVKLKAQNKKIAQQLVAAKLDAQKKLAAAKARGATLEQQLQLNRQFAAEQAAIQQRGAQQATQEYAEEMSQAREQAAYEEPSYSDDEDFEVEEEMLNELDGDDHDRLPPEMVSQYSHENELPADLSGDY